MGMTIDKCTNMLKAKEKCIERETSGTDIDCNLHNCDNCFLCYEQGTVGEQKEALRFAINTMRKYQKIQEILKDDTYYEEYGNNAEKFIVSAISEVLEDGNDNEKVEEMLRNLPSVTPQEQKILALLDKTFDDFCNCSGGESYFHIDGEDYNTDAVYALEGMEIFIKVLKKRLVKSEE